MLLNAGACGGILHDTRIEHFNAGLGKCGGISRRHQVAGLSCDPAGVADVGGDDGNGAGHGFADDVGEAFAKGDEVETDLIALQPFLSISSIQK